MFFAVAMKIQAKQLLFFNNISIKTPPSSSKNWRRLKEHFFFESALKWFCKRSIRVFCKKKKIKNWNIFQIIVGFKIDVFYYSGKATFVFQKHINQATFPQKLKEMNSTHIFLMSTKVNQQMKQLIAFFAKTKIQNWNIFQIIVGFKILVFCRCNEDSGKATFVFQNYINQITLLQKLKKIKRTHIFWISTKVILQVKQPRFLQKKKIKNWNIFQIIVGFKILVFYCCNENSGKATFVFQKHINQATFPQKLKEMNSTHIFLISTKVNQQVKQLCFLQKTKIQNWNIFQIIVGFKILVFCRCNKDSGKATFVFQKHINQITLPKKLTKIKRTHIFWISIKVILQVKQLCFLQKKK